MAETLKGTKCTKMLSTVMQKFDPTVIRFLAHFGREFVAQFGRDLTVVNKMF